MADEFLDAALLERVRDAIRKHSLSQCEFELCDDMAGCICFDQARAALLATGIPAAALNALARGDAVVVPKAQTREMVLAANRIYCPDGFGLAAKALEDARDTWPAMLAASPYACKE